MDTPYYEQLQYIGDTRIQALISYAVTGDDRLARQAIAAFANSRIPEGLTQSRYPSSLEQIIPPFSLYWIGMLDDLYWYRPDAQIVTANLQGTRDVLAWFFGYLQPDGLLREPPYWNFVDWVPEGQKIPTYDAHGESCVLSLELAGALRDAAELERALGDPAVAASYDARLKHMREGIYEHCWSPQRKLLADTPDRTVFSEHANILGVLYDVIPKGEQQDVLRRIVNDQEHLTPASYYFRFYLARALEHAGLGNLYLSSLGPWRDLLPMGFSTWPEMPGDSRSDSHAWSAHPTYDLLTIVGGIHPATPGFRTVRIAPQLGDLKKLTIHYPHPLGEIVAQYEWDGESLLKVEIVLPEGLEGSFEWHGAIASIACRKNDIRGDKQRFGRRAQILIPRIRRLNIRSRMPVAALWLLCSYAPGNPATSATRATPPKRHSTCSAMREPAVLVPQLRQQIHAGDVKKACRADRQQPVNRRASTGTEGCDQGHSKQRTQRWQHRHAQCAGRRVARMQQHSKVADAMGNLVQADRQRGDPANTRPGRKSGGHRDAIEKAMQAAGDDQIRRTKRMVRMAVSMDVHDRRIRISSMDDCCNYLLHAEKSQYASGKQIPDARRVAEAGDSLRQQMKQRRGQQQPGGNADEIRKKCSDRIVALAQQPRGQHRHCLQGKDSQQRVDNDSDVHEERTWLSSDATRADIC